MRLYALPIFLSAFLLFQVQPMIGKYILPWFGGSPAVWTTCMLFFQVQLLVGYSYAHLIVSHLSLRAQGLLHLVLLSASLLLLPITPSDSWKPTTEIDPTWQILALLTFSIGAPYVLLSSTGPLLQGWFSRRFPGRSPYRLYALSNAGSLLALLSYPLVFEQFLRLQTQTWLWSIGDGLFAVLCGGCALAMIKSAATNSRAPEPPTVKSNSDDSGATESEATDSRKPEVIDVVLWLGLTACGSTMLLATTNQMCQDVAVVPFLWIVPLSLYLLSFIICFDHERWYVRTFFSWAVVVGVFAPGVILYLGPKVGLATQVAVYSFTLFVCCMSCHGELVRMKPSPKYLTLFYLMIATGGALGGTFVTLLAPRIFDGFWEIHIGLVACLLLILIVGRRDALDDLLQRQLRKGPRGWATISAGGLAAGVVCVTLVWLGVQISLSRSGIVQMTRNFYGVLRVKETKVDNPLQRQISLTHGNTVHGVQFQAPEKRGQATTYYGPDTGIGVAVRHFPRLGNSHAGLRIGVVGLGIGTIATYATKNDYLRFYEINPQVVELSNEYFTYQKDALDRGVDVNVFLGDARIVMERQLSQEKEQHFDILVLDAFSSDAIPIHLLTEECFETYWQHLNSEGILAVHISNRYLDLSPVVRKLAELHRKETCRIDGNGDEQQGTRPSNWVLMTSNSRFLKSEAVEAARMPWPNDARKPLLWTDDFSSLYQLLK